MVAAATFPLAEVAALAAQGEIAVRAALGDAFLVIAPAGAREPGLLRTRRVAPEGAGSGGDVRQGLVVAMRGRPSPVSIGRARGNDVVIDDPSVSSFHSALVLDEPGWAVHDGGSKNGTFVNGRRAVERGAGEAIPLSPGAVLKVGSVEITFVDAAILARLASTLGTP